MSKMKIVPSFVELAEVDGKRSENPDFLLVRGRGTVENGNSSEVSWLMPASPGEFKSESDSESYRVAFESLKAAGLFQARNRKPDGTMAKGSVAKLQIVELIGDFAVGTCGTHKDDATGNTVPNKYTPVYLEGPLEIRMREAKPVNISPAALAALKRLG